MPTTNKLKGNLPSELGFEDLVKEANAGDQAALAKLRKTLDENPSLWRTMAKGIVGVSEETTTGVNRLYQMQRDGRLLGATENHTDHEADRNGSTRGRMHDGARDLLYGAGH